MIDPRPSIIRGINQDSLRVQHPEPFILLCGGAIDVKEAPRSMRDLVLRYIHDHEEKISKKIWLAEEVSDWFMEGVYLDLIDLETHLAHLSDLIVLIVESPGSIAELGAFSVVPEIRKKLQVFIRQERYRSGSFISLGPVKSIKRFNESAVRSYPWRTKSLSSDVVDASECSSEVRNICNDIVSADKKESREPRLRKNDVRHKMLLIVGLIDLFICSMRHELEEYLTLLDVPITGGELRQFLYLLERLGLVARYEYGNVYYIPKHPGTSDSLKFSFTDRPIDKLAAKVGLVRPYYQTKDPRRLDAIRAFRRREGAE